MISERKGMKLLCNFKEAFDAIRGKDEIPKFKLSFLKRLAPYFRTKWKKLLIGSMLMIVSSLLAMPTPYIMKYIVDDIIIKAGNINLLYLTLILLLFLQLVRLVISVLTRYYFSIFNQEIIVMIKKDLFHRILHFPLSFFDQSQTGYLLSRISEVEGLRFFFSDSLIQFLIGIFEFIFSLSILFFLNWKLTLISLTIIPVFYFTAKFHMGGIRKLSKDVMQKGAILSRQIQDSLSGIDIVKVFTAEERETNKIHLHLDALKKSNIKQNIVSSFSSEIMSFIGAIGGLVVLWFGGLNIIQGTFTIGGYIAFIGYLAKLYGPTQNAAVLGLSLQPSFTALIRLSEYYDITIEENDKENKIDISEIKNRIEFKNVYFSYGTKNVLRNISFVMNRGDKFLITGPNGSGKSTIIKLILGLYLAKHGEIIIDRYNINYISRYSLRDRISVVSQNDFLFNDTIKNNIIYSEPRASIEKVKMAIMQSGSNEFINKLDNGIETIVGESGRKLSGGERQKISIARAILKESDVIIFDEATSHQDKQSIERMSNLIENRFNNKISIIISHRPIKSLKINKMLELREGQIEKYKTINW